MSLMLEGVKLFVSGLVVILGIDAFWLGIVAKGFYDKAFAPFERTVRIAPASLIYIALILGILVFVLPRGDGNLSKTFLYGALFGFIAYGVFDLTNYATLAKWTLIPTVVDMFWGSFLIGIVSFILAYLKKII